MTEREMIEIIKEIAECNQDTCKDCKNICDYYSAITSFCEKVLPEGSVVLSKEEYNDLKGLEKHFDDYLIKEIKETRKETAEKFAAKIQDYLNDKVCEEFGDNACDVTYFTIDVDKVISDVFEIAEQFGVEVEE